MEAKPDRISSVGLIISRREELHKRLSKCRKVKDSKAHNHPNNVVKVAAYGLVREFLTERSDKRFLQAAKKLNVTPSPNAPVNLFRMAFQVLLDGNDYTLSDGNRSKFAKLLRYAYDHDVDPVWLPGFVLQAGGYEAIKKKLRKGRRERWLQTMPRVPFP